MLELRSSIDAFRKATNRLPECISDGDLQTIPSGATASAKVYCDRRHLMMDLAKGPIGAEVGVQAGNFSRFLLDTLELRSLHLLDMNTDMIRADVKADTRVILHKGDSSSQLRNLPPSSLDWAYIDGDHRAEGVMKDARAALKIVKPGGMLIFNDYTLWSPSEVMPYGVMSVVNRIVNEGHDIVGVALNPWGYFDLAIRC